jgi:hypothetical protein
MHLSPEREPLMKDRKAPHFNAEIAAGLDDPMEGINNIWVLIPFRVSE